VLRWWGVGARGAVAGGHVGSAGHAFGGSVDVAGAGAVADDAAWAGAGVVWASLLVAPNRDGEKGSAATDGGTGARCV
jgi:hypothetical protein